MDTHHGKATLRVRIKRTICDKVLEQQQALDKDPTRQKYLITMGREEQDEVMTYADILEHIECDAQQDRVWSFQHITDTKDPSPQTTPIITAHSTMFRYNGTRGRPHTNPSTSSPRTIPYHALNMPSTTTYWTNPDGKGSGVWPLGKRNSSGWSTKQNLGHMSPDPFIKHRFK
jgi:hypothetical protein